MHKRPTGRFVEEHAKLIATRHRPECRLPFQTERLHTQDVQVWHKMGSIPRERCTFANHDPLIRENSSNTYWCIDMYTRLSGKLSCSTYRSHPLNYSYWRYNLDSNAAFGTVRLQGGIPVHTLGPSGPTRGAIQKGKFCYSSSANGEVVYAAVVGNRPKLPDGQERAQLDPSGDTVRPTTSSAHGPTRWIALAGAVGFSMAGAMDFFLQGVGNRLPTTFSQSGFVGSWEVTKNVAQDTISEPAAHPAVAATHLRPVPVSVPYSSYASVRSSSFVAGTSSRHLQCSGCPGSSSTSPPPPPRAPGSRGHRLSRAGACHYLCGSPPQWPQKNLRRSSRS